MAGVHKLQVCRLLQMPLTALELTAAPQGHGCFQGIRRAARVWQGGQAESLSRRGRLAGLPHLPLHQLMRALQRLQRISLTHAQHK